MLSVTAVNRCRYCASLHGRLAQQAGIAAEEVDALLTGTLEPAPAAEHTALRYAANWAAAGGDSDPGSRAELLRIYGERTAEAIDSALLAIRIGNLVGNSLEHWVCRVLPWRACADALRPAAGADEARS